MTANGDARVMNSPLREVSWREAERLAGQRVDRRRRYAWDDDVYGSGCAGLLELVRWTDTCSGCCETGEYGSFGHYYETDPKHRCLIGSGCDECGYTGKRRNAMWVPSLPHRPGEQP